MCDLVPPGNVCNSATYWASRCDKTHSGLLHHGAETYTEKYTEKYIDKYTEKYSAKYSEKYTAEDCMALCTVGTL